MPAAAVHRVTTAALIAVAVVVVVLVVTMMAVVLAGADLSGMLLLLLRRERMRDGRDCRVVAVERADYGAGVHHHRIVLMEELLAVGQLGQIDRRVAGQLILLAGRFLFAHAGVQALATVATVRVCVVVDEEELGRVAIAARCL